MDLSIHNVEKTLISSRLLCYSKLALASDYITKNWQHGYHRPWISRKKGQSMGVRVRVIHMLAMRMVEWNWGVQCITIPREELKKILPIKLQLSVWI